MGELKRIHERAIPAALERAKQYRLLNEPQEGESICRDILEVDPSHQDAIRTLLLALTDQFERDLRTMRAEAVELLARLRSEYERGYYDGVIHERAGKALLEAGYPRAAVYEAVREAMDLYAKAIDMAPDGDDEAILRWNTCVRMIERHGLCPSEAGEHEMEVESFDDEVPHR